MSDSSAGEVFRSTLKTILAARGISNAEFARMGGFSRAYAGQILNGDRVPTLTSVEKFAKILSIPAWSFLIDGDHPEVNKVFAEFFDTAAEIPQLADLIEWLVQASPEQRETLLRVAHGLFTPRT